MICATFSPMTKVLLVDDIRLFLEIEQTLLNRPDITIFTATSGEEALAIHERENVDVILLDLLMPGMDGEKVCQYIRADKKLKGVSIIMVTTSTSPEDIERCIKAGANDYIGQADKSYGASHQIPEICQCCTALGSQDPCKDGCGRDRER